MQTWIHYATTYLHPARLAWLCLIAITVPASVTRGDDRLPPDGDPQPQVVAIGRMARPPVLDGKLSDWPADATAIVLGNAPHTLRRPGGWSGASDLSGSVRLAWDNEFLYVAADIVDNKLLQAEGPSQVWQGDTIEMFFNTFPNQQRTDGFWQIALVPPLKPGAKLAVVGSQKPFEGVEGTAAVHDGGYTLECRIPWKNLERFTPATGMHLGVQIYLDDRDDQGRHAQLAWYPSAITFTHPSHTNVVILRDTGDTTLPRVVAGPQYWSVTDQQTARISVMADVPGAKTAELSRIQQAPAATATTQATAARPAVPVTPPLSIDLHQAGDRICVGETALPVAGPDGPAQFSVTVRDAQGNVLATNLFQAQLGGQRFARVMQLTASIKTRLKALETKFGVDAQARAGLNEWMTRCNAVMGNEGRAECLSGWLLDQWLVELTDLTDALTTLEAGGAPYAQRHGSFVRAYPSPLTGEFRPYALYVPEPSGDNLDQPRPLIVLLHSIYADERQLLFTLNRFRDLGAIVYQGAAYRQFDWSGISAAETWAGLDDVLRNYRVDPDRIYLMGHHVGGRGVWQLAMARPDFWAAAAPMFSGIDTLPPYPALRLYPDFYPQASNILIPPPMNTPTPKPEPITQPLERRIFEQYSLASQLENISRLPLRSAYGEDEANAAAERLAMQDRLAQLGAPLATHYQPGAMHGIAPNDVSDPSFYTWLLSHRRPAYPKKLTYIANGLRYNTAWWVRVDALTSPVDLGRISAAITADRIEVQTKGVSALSLLLDQRLSAVGTKLSIAIDGQSPLLATVAAEPTWLGTQRDEQGHWAIASPAAGQKRHGLSGPINDFQFERFIVVYGTGADATQNAAMEKLSKGFADWGHGAIFTCKADRDVTDADIRDAHLLVIGTPKTNLILAKAADRLPLRWLDHSIQLGNTTVEGPGASACVIYPNPLSPQRYMVVITAMDDAGYQIWSRRGLGDYALGNVTTDAGKAAFGIVAQGYFDNRWQWDSNLCLKPAGKLAP